MTYRELYEKAERQLEKGEITSGEFDEMTKPLDEQIRPHGAWLFVDNPNYSPFDGSSENTRICSKCSFKYSYKPVFNYCPNCGARMKAGDSE